MSTHNLRFHGEISKIVYQLSHNTHLTVLLNFLQVNFETKHFSLPTFYGR